MKQKLLSLLTALTLLAPFAMPLPAAAVDVFPGCEQGGSLAKANADICNTVKSKEATTGNPIIGTIKKVTAILGYAIGVAAIIILIINGMKLMVGDDAKAMEQARSGIIYAMVGIAVAVLAETLVALVLNRF